MSQLSSPQPQGPISTAQPQDETYSKDSDVENESQEPHEITKLAQHLLASLSGKRMEPAEIKFMETGRQDSGGKGDVMVATLVSDSGSTTHPDGRPVAVKKLKFSRETNREKMLKAFVNELRILDKLSHPHIVKMAGFVEDIKSGILWIVSPWEANGNVREFLRTGNWEIPERVSLIQDVAEGLEYLHTREPPICHGDLKSLNVLVNDSCRAVIIDFGSARALAADRRTNRGEASMNRTEHRSDQSWQIDVSISNNQLTLTGPRWSLRWAAPEILNGQELDLASDVWAFGWICWEIMTDNYPFPEANGEGLITLKVVAGQLPSADSHDQLSQIRSLFSIMLDCWKAEAEKRPSAIECGRRLRWIPACIPTAQVRGESGIRSAALLVQLGRMHSSHGRYDAATEMLEKALTLARSTDDKPILARALGRLGLIYSNQGKFAKAEECLAQALEIFTRIGDDWGQADALYVLGYVQAGWSEYVKAEEYYTQALEIFTRVGDGQGRANTLHLLGSVQQARSGYAKAEEYYTQALEIFTRVGDDRGRAGALGALGSMQREQLKYAKAEESYSQALEVVTRIGDDHGRARALKGLGDIQLGRSKYAEAEKFYIEVLEIYTRIGDDLGRAYTLDWLGEAQRRRSKYAEAEKLYSQALEIFKRVGDARGQTNSSLGLGEIRLRQARYAEAKALISDAAEIAERIECQWGKEYSQKLLTDVLAAERRPRGLRRLLQLLHL